MSFPSVYLYLTPPALARPQHEFPKSSVDVFVHVLEDDGGALAAAITAASAALADASVPMYDLVTAAALVSHEPWHDVFKC